MSKDEVLVVRPEDDDMVPVLLEVGKRKGKHIKDLKQGRGPLMDEVEKTLENVRAQLKAEGDNKELLPLVLVYKQKAKRKRGTPWGFGQMG